MPDGVRRDRPAAVGLEADVLARRLRVAPVQVCRIADDVVRVERDRVPGTALDLALRLDAPKLTSGQRAGVANEGYWGIPIKPDATYRASFYARASRDGKEPLRSFSDLQQLFEKKKQKPNEGEQPPPPANA